MKFKKYDVVKIKNKNRHFYIKKIKKNNIYLTTGRWDMLVYDNEIEKCPILTIICKPYFYFIEFKERVFDNISNWFKV